MTQIEYAVHRTALIDADFIAYKLAAWAHGNQADALEMATRIDEMFNDWLTRACCTEFLICFSCDREDNFRKDHYPLYKSNRTQEPPAMLGLAKEILSNKGTVITIPHLEADDVMGILATGTKLTERGTVPVIISEDKDMRQIPGWHFNPAKEDFPVWLSEDDADLTFFTQWLTGDSTDGFGGIKGCGPAKAKKILGVQEQVSVEWDGKELPTYAESLCLLALRAYREKYTLEEALAQARCARILRTWDFDVSARIPIPWSPSDKIMENTLG